MVMAANFEDWDMPDELLTPEEIRIRDWMKRSKDQIILNALCIPVAGYMDKMYITHNELLNEATDIIKAQQKRIDKMAGWLDN